MTSSNQPNVIMGLLAIHGIITRGLDVAIEKSQVFAEEGFPDTSTRTGFLDYVRCLVSVLGIHHETEDKLAFPYFRDRMDAPYDILTGQHRQMEPILEEIRAGVDEAATQQDAAGALKKVRLGLCKAKDLWHPHIAIEEEHFTVERAASAIPADEHIRLSKEFLEHAQKNTGPDYLIVPFLLYNLPAEKRRLFANEMPPVVTEQLVPVVWKEKWAPMQPFLLN